MIAMNNPKVDYLKQAYYSAKRLYELTGLKSAVVTDGEGYIRRVFEDYKKYIDVINSRTITIDRKNTQRRYYDGHHSYKMLPFQNEFRVAAFDVSPYDETLLIDTDILWNNKDIFKVFDDAYLNDFALYKKCVPLNPSVDYDEFMTINHAGIDFYWATCVYFKKTDRVKKYFDTVKHLYDNWDYFSVAFDLRRKVFRNDYLFSLALHYMNDFTTNTFASELPGTLYFTIDKDILLENTHKQCFDLSHGDVYAYTEVQNENIHVMNKFSLGRVYDQNG